MKRGEIYLIKITENIGNLQAGLRPVVIIQNDKGNEFSPTTIVCCITSQHKKPLPTHLDLSEVGGLRDTSIMLGEQIFTINKTDLKQKIGAITNKHTLNRLDRCLRLSLGIKRSRQ